MLIILHHNFLWTVNISISMAMIREFQMGMCLDEIISMYSKTQQVRSVLAQEQNCVKRNRDLLSLKIILQLFLVIYLYFLQATQSSFSTTTDYSTTSFKDAKIQYRPYGSYKYHKAEEEAEDVPMPMIDIQLPFNNHSHIVTWLDPDKMSPKLNRDVFQVYIPKPIFQSDFENS